MLGAARVPRDQCLVVDGDLGALVGHLWNGDLLDPLFVQETA